MERGQKTNHAFSLDELLTLQKQANAEIDYMITHGGRAQRQKRLEEVSPNPSINAAKEEQAKNLQGELTSSSRASKKNQQ